MTCTHEIRKRVKFIIKIYPRGKAKSVVFNVVYTAKQHKARVQTHTYTPTIISNTHLLSLQLM